LSTSPPILSIFFHNYYGNDQEWLTFLKKEINLPFYLFYNGVAGSYYRLTQTATLTQAPEQHKESRLQQLVVKASTNKGKDIGGKLILMDAWLKLAAQSDYILLLHDKHSPYHSNSDRWKKDLFRIAENALLPRILELFQDPQTGIVASANAIRNEADNEQKSNFYINSPLITSLKEQYGITDPNLLYVAGTMFWVRAGLFKEFFSTYSPLAIRATLESGNITDTDAPTITHAWERLLCWIITNKGYQIKGV
jgi:lipopolysaccharide biosynthesis protein